MADETKKLEIGIYRREPKLHHNVIEIDVGPLLHELTQEPIHLANVGEDGTVKLSVERTHEWEIIIGLAVTGSGIFLTGVLKELGKRFGGWLAD